jgi:hypothetical protein
MVKKWQSSAAERLSEMPPKKRTNIGVHLIVSTTGQKKAFSPSRCRSMAKVRGNCLQVSVRHSEMGSGTKMLNTTAIPMKNFYCIPCCCNDG